MEDIFDGDQTIMWALQLQLSLQHQSIIKQFYVCDLLASEAIWKQYKSSVNIVPIGNVENK